MHAADLQLLVLGLESRCGGRRSSAGWRRSRPPAPRSSRCRRPGSGRRSPCTRRTREPSSSRASSSWVSYGFDALDRQDAERSSAGSWSGGARLAAGERARALEPSAELRELASGSSPGRTPRRDGDGRPTPEMSHCTTAPPSSSLSIRSPIAACTRCEPARKIEPVPFDDVRLVAHDRQVGAAGDARADDRRHLEDAVRRQPGVVVEDPAVVLAVGEDLVLERQEDAGRVDQVDDRQPVLERDLLRRAAPS